MIYILAAMVPIGLAWLIHQVAKRLTREMEPVDGIDHVFSYLLATCLVLLAGLLLSAVFAGTVALLEVAFGGAP